MALAHVLKGDDACVVMSQESRVLRNQGTSTAHDISKFLGEQHHFPGGLQVLELSGIVGFYEHVFHVMFGFYFSLEHQTFFFVQIIYSVFVDFWEHLGIEIIQVI